jgi:hypothetical protein
MGGNRGRETVVAISVNLTSNSVTDWGLAIKLISLRRLRSVRGVGGGTRVCLNSTPTPLIKGNSRGI